MHQQLSWRPKMPFASSKKEGTRSAIDESMDGPLGDYLSGLRTCSEEFDDASDWNGDHW